MKHILISGNTDAGKRRKENQDAWIARPLWSADTALLVVIDGVGGYMGGEKAAAIAKECIGQYMEHPKGDTLTMLREAVVYANNRIVEERSKDQLISEMCCVLTAVVADATTQSLYYVHVGDTRLYRFRNGKLQKLTKDHSFVGIREDAGEMTEQEAMSHPHRNQILREVGSTEHRLGDEDFMDYGREDLLPGDYLLLCSDGLTDMATAGQITTVLSTAQPVPNKVNSLIALANEMGGNDNITTVLFKFKPAPAKKQVSVTPPVVKTNSEVPVSATVREHKVAQQNDNRQALPVNPAAVTGEAVATPRKSFFASPAKLGMAMMGLLLVALVCWFFTPPRSIEIMPPAVLPVDSIRTATTQATSTRETRPAVPGPVITERTDTLRINATQSWNRIQHILDSTGKYLVILPAKKNNTRFAAIGIDVKSAQPGDTLILKNIRIQQFETGFKVEVPVMIKTDNLVFENIKYPFQHLVKPDSSHPSILIMNHVKR